jgi:hypothetical protein
VLLRFFIGGRAAKGGETLNCLPEAPLNILFIGWLLAACEAMLQLAMVSENVLGGNNFKSHASVHEPHAFASSTKTGRALLDVRLLFVHHCSLVQLTLSRCGYRCRCSGGGASVMVVWHSVSELFL